MKSKSLALYWVESWDKEKDVDLRIMNTWKAYTRMMFWNYPALKVFEWVDDCLAEASDEQILQEKLHKKNEQEVNAMLNSKPISYYRGKRAKIINENLKITDVARQYGLKVKGTKAVCPFHDDKDPSLSFNDKKNVFHCFGCNEKGDIRKFIVLMNRIKKEVSKDND